MAQSITKARHKQGDEEMKEQDKSYLKSIMKEFDQKLTKSKDAKDQRESQGDAFYVEFKQVRAQVIRPAMEDIGNELKSGGYIAEISEVGDERSKRDAKITMIIAVGGIPTSGNAPANTVSISFSYSSGYVAISVDATPSIKNRSRFDGPRDKYVAAEITTDLVQKKILDVLGEVLSPR
jgi:hypothetical protein